MLKKGKNVEAFIFFADAIYFRTRFGETIVGYPVWDFYAYMRVLDLNRKSRIQSGAFSIARSMLWTNFDDRYVSKAELLETDFLLYLRSYADNSDQKYWTPRTLIFGDSISTGFPLFQEASRVRGYKFLQQIIGIDERTSLVNFLVSDGVVLGVERASSQNIFDYKMLINYYNLWKENS